MQLKQNPDMELAVDFYETCTGNSFNSYRECGSLFC